MEGSAIVVATSDGEEAGLELERTSSVSQETRTEDEESLAKTELWQPFTSPANCPVEDEDEDDVLDFLGPKRQSNLVRSSPSSKHATTQLTSSDGKYWYHGNTLPPLSSSSSACTETATAFDDPPLQAASVQSKDSLAPMLDNHSPLALVSCQMHEGRACPQSLAAGIAVGSSQSARQAVTASSAQHESHDECTQARVSSHIDDATAAAIQAAQHSPGPFRPTRALRTRKAAQLQPYTVEMLRYRRELVRNDWQDAVVTLRRERERLRAEKDAHEDEDEDENDDDNDNPVEVAERKQRALELLDRRSRDRERRRQRELAKEARRRSEQEKFAETRRIFDHFGGDLSDSDSIEDGAIEHGGSAVGGAAGTKRRKVDMGARVGSRAHRTSRQNGRDGSSQAEGQDSFGVRASRHPANSAMTISSDSDSGGELPRIRAGAGRRVRPSSRQRHRTLSSSSSLSNSTAHSSDTSPSSAATDYSAYFRKLKRMMPTGMARKHINDLKNMRRGKAYHSDGHVSVTPEPEDPQRRARVDARASTDANAGIELGEVRPGEARKKRRRQGLDEDPDRFAILGDAESSSDRGNSESAMLVSSPHAHSPPSDMDGWNDGWNESTYGNDIDSTSRSSPHGCASTARHRQRGPASLDNLSQAEEDTGLGWTALKPQKSAPARFKEGDMVDRLLQRTGGGQRRCRTARRQRRQADQTVRQRGEHRAYDHHPISETLEDFASARKQLGTSSWSTTRGSGRRVDVLRERSNNSPVQQLTTSALRTHNSDPRRKRKRKRDERIGRSKVALTGPALRHNPPVVVPRIRPRLDLQTDGALFEGTRHGRLQQARDKAADPVLLDIEKLEWVDLGMGLMEDYIADDPAAPIPFPVTQQSESEGIRSIEAAQHRQPALVHPIPAVQAVKAAIVADASIAAQQLEADAWADVQNIRIDFGICPSAVSTVRFGPSTLVGSGELARLLRLGKADERANDIDLLIAEQIECSLPFGHDLTSTSDTYVTQLLPSLFDEIFAATTTLSRNSAWQSEEPTPEATQILAALRALCNRCDGRQQVDRTSSGMRVFSQTTLAQIDRHIERLKRELSVLPAPGSQLESLIYMFHWVRIELLWRSNKSIPAYQPNDTQNLLTHKTYDEDFATAVRRLMRALLTHGLHRTMKSIKDAARENDFREESLEISHRKVTDSTADLWVSLIHLLNETDDLDRKGTSSYFWAIFDDTCRKWLDSQRERGPLVESELIFYLTLAINALGRIPILGQGTVASDGLRPHWPLIARSLALRLRYHEAVERRMRSVAISQRDEYIRTLLTRCVCLHKSWGWSLRSADSVLRRFFDIFNDYSLADLPSERDHDYPAFLREYNEDVLQESEVREEDTAFQIFVRLLALAGQELRSIEEDKLTGDRKVGRLLSRMMPVRVMSFTQEKPPTSLERSMLFNHYTLVMLFLHLVPRAARQRVIQIQSFIAFANADWASQIACARAMMYAAIIHRHHELSAAPIMQWYGTVVTTVCQQLRDLGLRIAGFGRAGGDEGVARTAIQRQLRLNSLLAVCLRSIQHVVDHASLNPSKSGNLDIPDVCFLDRAWTKDLLESQIALEPLIGIEALNCVYTCLTKRNSAVGLLQRTLPKTQPHSTPAEESQDSMADMFNDSAFDFDDAALDALLGGQTQAVQSDNARAEKQNAAAALKKKDRLLADHLSSIVSPALHRLLFNTFHPDRLLDETTRPCLAMRTELMGEDTERRLPRSVLQRHMEATMHKAAQRKQLELLIDCWAGCGAVLVCHRMRTWRSYMDSFGAESFKRIDDHIGRRDVGLRFMHNIAVLNPEAYCRRKDDKDGSSLSCDDFIATWFQTVGAMDLSIQNLFTTVLLELDPQQAIFANVQWHRVPAEVANPIDSTPSQASPKLTLEEFAECRLRALSTVFTNMCKLEASSSTPGATKRTLYAWASGLFLALRQNFAVATQSPALSRARGAQIEDYVQFCKAVAQAARSNLGAPLISGTERGGIIPLETLIARHEGQPLVGPSRPARLHSPLTVRSPAFVACLPPPQPPTFTPSPPPPPPPDTAPPPYQSP